MNFATSSILRQLLNISNLAFNRGDRILSKYDSDIFDRINFSVFVWCNSDSKSCKTAAVCRGKLSGFSEAVISCVTIDGSLAIRGAIVSFLTKIF